jgi:hypothetical protein
MVRQATRVRDLQVMRDSRQAIAFRARSKDGLLCTFSACCLAVSRGFVRGERRSDRRQNCKILQLPDLLRVGFLSGFCFPRLRLWLVFFLRGGIAVRRRACRGSRRLLRVVGDVPARAFELDRRCGDHLLDRSAAIRAFFDVRIGELLDFLKPMMAFLALILVDGHGDCRRDTTPFYSDSRDDACGRQFTSRVRRA